jgi:carbamoyl-phosphate synthase large subunit
VVDLSADEFPAPGTGAGEDLRAGYAEFFDLVEFDDETAFEDALRAGEIDLVVSRRRGPLEVAVEEEVTYFSTHASARAALEALRARDEPLDVAAVSERPRRVARWGADGA